MVPTAKISLFNNAFEFFNKLNLTNLDQWRRPRRDRLLSERVERAVLKKDGVKSKQSHLGNECLFHQDKFEPYYFSCCLGVNFSFTKIVTQKRISYFLGILFQ